MGDNKRREAIEALAQSLRNESLRPTKVDRIKSQLMNLLLDELHMSDFTAEGLAQNSSDTMADKQRPDAPMETVTLARVFQSALAAYGTLDAKTNKPIPFLVLFFSHYRQKKPESIKQYWTLEREQRQGRVHIGDFMRRMARKLGVEESVETQVSNFMNKEACAQFLRHHGADDTCIDELYRLYEQLGTVSLVGEEEEETPDRSAPLQMERYRRARQAETELLYVLRRLKEIPSDKTTKMYLKLKVTFVLLQQAEEDRSLLEYTDTVDTAAMTYYHGLDKKQRRSMKVSVLIAGYLGRQPETVRKQMNQVDKILYRLLDEL